jgi:2-desacetyl-2-hydroxyethyl bacteriochlorophyllide A dehydrogenase
MGIVLTDGRAEFETVEVAAPGPGEVLIETRLTQISPGSEGNALRRSAGQRLRPGYAAVGRVAAIGPGVTGYSLGDRVLTMARHVSHALIAVAAPEALRDDDHRSYLERLDDGVTDGQATFAILGDVALHGVRLAGLQIGEAVAIFGLGGVGQLIGQFARLSGADPIVGVDPDPDRRALAAAVWATHTVAPGADGAAEAVRELTDGGARTLFQASSDPSMLPDMLRSAAVGGKIVLVGATPGREVSLGLWSEFLHRELRLIASYSASRNIPHPYWPWTRVVNRRHCLRLMATGQLTVDRLISHVVPVAEAPAVYAMIAAGPQHWIGVQFTWHEAGDRR